MRSAYAPQAIDFLLMHAATTVQALADGLGITYPTASRIIDALIGAELVEEITGRSRNRVFLYRPYIEVLGGAFRPTEE
jgi:DNA-binding MarR family transcriptional regulator